MGVYFLPILFHGDMEFTSGCAGESTLSQYPWVKNWLYRSTLHRTDCGLLNWLARLHATLADARDVHRTRKWRSIADPWALAFMFVGLVASSFHLGVGIWNFLCKWGLAATVGRSAWRQLGRGNRVVFSFVGVICPKFSIGLAPLASYLTPK